MFAKQRFFKTNSSIWNYSRSFFTKSSILKSTLLNHSKGFKEINYFSTSSPSGDQQTEDALSRHRYSLVRPIYSFILKSKMTADPDLARFLAKSGAVSIYSLAGVTALGTIGIDTAPILTGIGITGFTVGFALKEIATNFLSGVMLVFGKPFRKGQWLKVLGTVTQLEGEVQSIDARYVLLRTKDKALVMIPSVVVYTNPILVSNSSISSPSASSTTSITNPSNNTVLSTNTSSPSNTSDSTSSKK